MHPAPTAAGAERPDPRDVTGGVRLAAVPAACAALAVAACAGSGETLHLTPPPPPESPCYLGHTPASPAEVLDEESLRASLAAGPGGRWSAVLVLDPDSVGGWEDPVLLPGATAGTPPDLAVRVRTTLAPPPPEEEGFLLRVDAAEEIVLRTGAREYCPPVMLDRRRTAREFSEAIEGRVPPRTERVLLWLRVDTVGGVFETRVEEEALDRATQATVVAFALERLRFRPATIDRVPVRVWVQIPFTVSVRRNERDPCPGILRDAPDRPEGMPRC